MIDNPYDVRAYCVEVEVHEGHFVYVEAKNEKEAKERAERVRITRGSRFIGGKTAVRVIPGCYLPLKVAKTHKEGWKYYG